MKKIILGSFMVIASSLSVFALEESRDFLIKNVTTLSKDELGIVLSQEHENVVVEFSTGTILPVNFFLKGEVLSLVGEEKEIGQIKIERTFYIRPIGEEFLFSLDLMEWKPFWDLFTGAASIYLSTENMVPSITFGAEATTRE